MFEEGCNVRIFVVNKSALPSHDSIQENTKTKRIPGERNLAIIFNIYKIPSLCDW
jgi:hypothetical protein